MEIKEIKTSKDLEELLYGEHVPNQDNDLIHDTYYEIKRLRLLKMLSTEIIEKVRAILDEYKKVDECSPATPWCDDPNYANLDHYHCHSDKKRELIIELRKIFSI